MNASRQFHPSFKTVQNQEADKESDSEEELETASDKEGLNPEDSNIEVEKQREASEGVTLQKQGEDFKLNEWWENVNLYKYFSKEGLPKNLKVFLPDDSEEFMETVISNYKSQELKKKTLDEQMEEKEETDEPYQFSEARDQPLIDEFQKYVESQSTKNALHMYSTGYDEDSAKAGPKSGFR